MKQLIFLSSIVIAFSCNTDCKDNLDKKKLAFVNSLNQKYSELDTLYINGCLPNYLTVKVDSVDISPDIQNSIENIYSDIENNGYKRDIWVLDKWESFEYRLTRDKHGKFNKSSKQFADN